MTTRDRGTPRRTGATRSAIKLLITVATVAGTISGWAALATQEASATTAAASSPPPIWLQTLPALPQLPAVGTFTGAAQGVAALPISPSAPVLRRLTAPPAPITTTRSSR